MKQIVLTLILLLSASMVQAKTWMEMRPENYSRKACTLIKNPSAGCNKGKEAFSTFMKHFTTDKTFRKTRLKDSTHQLGIDMIDYLESYRFFTGHEKGRMGTFYNVSANMVCCFIKESRACSKTANGTLKFIDLTNTENGFGPDIITDSEGIIFQKIIIRDIGTGEVTHTGRHTL